MNNERKKKRTQRSLSILTDGADDGGAAIVLRRNIFGVELRGPLKLHAIGQMIQRVGHRCRPGGDG